MAVTLSEHDLRRLSSVITTLCSPTGPEGFVDWRREVGQALMRCLEADRAVLLMPGASGGPVFVEGHDHRALTAYRDRYSDLDLGQQRVRAGRHSVWTRARLFERDPATLFRSECYSDWLLPNRVLDSVGLSLVPPRDTFTLFACHFESPLSTRDTQRVEAVLRLLFPAFATGTRAVRSDLSFAQNTRRVIDAVDDAIAIHDRRGRPVYRNRALERLLSRINPREASSDLVGHIEHAARALIALASPDRTVHLDVSEPMPVRTVRVAGRRYELRPLFMRRLTGDRPKVVFVVVSERSRGLPTERGIQSRFGLTPREAQVSLLLARRLSDREIAQALDVRPRTARKHTERVLGKLGLSSRRSVRDALMPGRSREREPPRPSDLPSVEPWQ